jgi:hypothetical protein
LQTLLAHNRLQLEKHGFYVPTSKWDDLMLEGKITPGNGALIAGCLAERRWTKLARYWKEVISNAQKKHCSKVVISNEILIRCFSDFEALDQMEETALDAGFTKIKCLAILRNVYDHALSLYRHRAKNGMPYSFEEWFRHDYETIRLFVPFLANKKLKAKIEWSFSLYEKAAKLEKVFFQMFLGYREKLTIPTNNQVNASLSMRQVALIQEFESKHNGISKYMYPAFLKAKVKNDKDEVTRRSEFYRQAKNYFSSFETELQAISSLLNSDIERRSFLSSPLSRSDDEVKDAPISLELNNEEQEQVVKALRQYKANWKKDFLLMAYTKLKRLFIFRKIKALSRFGGSIRY